MVNSFVFLFDIPVMINILYKMIKILHEKMLNAIYLYWFHNGTLAEDDSLNGHSNKPWINGRGSSYLLPSKIFLVEPLRSNGEIIAESIIGMDAAC